MPWKSQHPFLKPNNSIMMLAAAARATRKSSLLLPCQSSPINLTFIQVRWMHPEQRLIEKRKIAFAAAHKQVAELQAKQAAEQAAIRSLQVGNEKRETKMRTLQQVYSALPKPKMNDGISSGAVAERRLREKRQAILEKMMQESLSKE
jgi:hypothetical protein